MNFQLNYIYVICQHLGQQLEMHRTPEKDFHRARFHLENLVFFVKKKNFSVWHYSLIFVNFFLENETMVKNPSETLNTRVSVAKSPNFYYAFNKKKWR